MSESDPLRFTVNDAPLNRAFRNTRAAVKDKSTRSAGRGTSASLWLLQQHSAKILYP